MNTKAVINENLKSEINEILENITRIVDEKAKEDPCDPEVLIKYTKALESSLCAAQRFDFINGKCGEIIDTDTEFKLSRTVQNITEVILKTCVRELSADDLLKFVKLLDLAALSWKRLYSFGETNPYA